MSRILAIDTETTGVDLYIGKDLQSSNAKPFAVSTCDNEGNYKYFSFPVDLTTRQPIYNHTQLARLSLHIYSYDTWVFHNANFDLRALFILKQAYGYEAESLDKLIFNHNIHDTLIASHIIDSEMAHGLKPLAKHFLDVSDDDESALHDAINEAKRFVRSKKAQSLWGLDTSSNVGFWFPRAVANAYSDAPRHWADVCETYAIKDVERTMGLHLLFQEILKERGELELYEEQLKLIPVILNIQRNGMHFFMGKARAEHDTLTAKIADAEKELNTLISKHLPEYLAESINTNSSKQMIELLFDKLKLPILDWTPKGEPSTSASNLNRLLHKMEESPEVWAMYDNHLLRQKSTEDKLKVKALKDDMLKFLKLLMEMRLWVTTTRYIDNYFSYVHQCNVGTKTKRQLWMIYPNLNQTGTSTTRLSSSNPNGQNISTGVDDFDEDGNKSKKLNLRTLFGPRPGYKWYSIDYKSLQLIIFAYESGDKGMIDAFKKGYDFHNYVACGLFETDKPTSDQRRIAKNVNYALIFGAGKNRVDATAGMDGAYDLYENQFPVVKEYMEKVMRQVRKNGFVKTAFGYPLVVPRTQPYKGVNYIVQGDEGDIVKKAMRYCHQFLKDQHPKANLIMQIHDELVFECPVNYKFPLKEICKLMEAPALEIGWETPVDASIVLDHWGNKQKIGGDDD